MGKGNKMVKDELKVGVSDAWNIVTVQRRQRSFKSGMNRVFLMFHQTEKASTCFNHL